MHTGFLNNMLLHTEWKSKQNWMVKKRENHSIMFPVLVLQCLGSLSAFSHNNFFVLSHWDIDSFSGLFNPLSSLLLVRDCHPHSRLWSNNSAPLGGQFHVSTRDWNDPSSLFTMSYFIAVEANFAPCQGQTLPFERDPICDQLPSSLSCSSAIVTFVAYIYWLFKEVHK